MAVVAVGARAPGTSYGAPVARVDYSDRAGAYRSARTLPAAVLRSWDEAVRPIAAARAGAPGAGVVLDLGAGPGGFLDPLAEWFGGRVVAVEIADAMRAEAQRAGTADRFSYVAGRAEQIPLADASVDAAWLSTVVHQFDDLDAAAVELRRVVRPRGLVLVRGFFGDQSLTGLFELFPGIERAAATFPTTDAVLGCFERAGFARRRVIDVVERWTFELDAWTDRVRAIRHTDSALRPLTDADFEAGVAAVHASRGGQVDPVVSDTILRLLVLGEPADEAGR